jgi:hypothetical protein
MLVDRGIIVPNSILWNLETSSATQEVWLSTHDLEPDLSDETMGAVVNENLRSGKRYVYFIPSRLPDSEQLRTRLRANIGILNAPRLSARVTFVEVDETESPGLFQRSNSIVFFRGNPGETSPLAFEEVVLTKLARRGVYWQEYVPAETDKLVRRLGDALARTSSADRSVTD